MDVGKVLALGGEAAPFKESLCKAAHELHRYSRGWVDGPVMIIVE